MGRLQKNDSGFSAVETVLVLVVVAIIGFVGWYVWKAKQNTSKTLNEANSALTGAKQTGSQVSKANPEAQNALTNIPSDWTWYEIKDLGIKFAYPKSWGTPTGTLKPTDSQAYRLNWPVIDNPKAPESFTLDSNSNSFNSDLANIKNGTFVAPGPNASHILSSSDNSYSWLSHWSNDAGNQYQFDYSKLVNLPGVTSASIVLQVATGSDTCPTDKVAPNDQSKCITQTDYSNALKTVDYLQKM